MKREQLTTASTTSCGHEQTTRRICILNRKVKSRVYLSNRFSFAPSLTCRAAAQVFERIRLRLVFPSILTFVVSSLITNSSFALEPAAFFNQHCVRCHGDEEQEGDLRLDTISADADLWLEIADRMDFGEMPPEGEPQPPRADVKSMVAWAKTKAADASHAGQVVLRRLNRPQYRNTIRDLLKIDTFVEDPTEAFPADDEKEGFDNLGESLQMSDFLLRQYLRVARRAIADATFMGDRPEPQTYSLNDTKSRTHNWRGQKARHPNLNYVTLYQSDERAPGDPRGQSLINCRDGVTHDGWYEFTFVVESRGRGILSDRFGKDTRIDRPIYRPEDLHRFEFYLTKPSSQSQVQTRPRHLVGTWDLPDNERVTIKQRVWLKKEWRVEIAFGNGYTGITDPILLVDPDFDLDEFRELPKREQNSKYGELLIERLEAADAPRVLVHEATEVGPLYDEWPPESHQIVHTSNLPAFAERAFRRPVTEDEVRPYLELAEMSPDGTAAAVAAMLCSPRFLYFDEPEGQLDDFALASRLSYFLWNTMPDEALFADARAGVLREPAYLQKHLDRMLGDERSDEFVRYFLWAWLHLKNATVMAPDLMKYPDYHRNRIAEAMMKETQAFFRHVLTENLPLETFLDSDFTFVNSDLARLYDLKSTVTSSVQFQKMSLAGLPNRGGLLGQASVLTASANGVDTSPVIRGIWILENLLGTPPSPPPPDVPITEPDMRGDLTIRQMYAKHRTVESCNQCHKKIDPLGFALENFDAVGTWRERYENGHDVDASGRMPSGETFGDLDELKEILTRDTSLFSRNLTSKLLTYATGRTMEAGDRAEIERITAELRRNDGGLKDLLSLVVASEIFREK